MFTNPYTRIDIGYGGVPESYLDFIKDLPEEEQWTDETYVKYLEHCGCFDDPLC